MSKTALIFVHQKNLGSCLFGSFLEENGFSLRTFRANAEDMRKLDPLAADMMIVMGGPIGVYQADDYPFLYEEMEFLRARIEGQRPTLGICLGAQLLARALGASVYKGSFGREAGWREIEATPAGAHSPIRHLCAPYTKIMQWHGDTFEMPQGAELLATSEPYKNQIFSYGPNILGMQCHPEVTHERMLEWYVGLVDEVTGPSPVVPLRVLREETERYVTTANRQARMFFHEWLAQVGLMTPPEGAADTSLAQERP